MRKSGERIAQMQNIVESLYGVGPPWFTALGKGKSIKLLLWFTKFIILCKGVALVSGDKKVKQ